MTGEKAIQHFKVIFIYSRYATDQLLVATIMAAQTTDKLVNTLTPALFAKYKTIQDMADVQVEDIAALISKVSFANNKAKNIKAAAQVEKHRRRLNGI